MIRHINENEAVPPSSIEWKSRNLRFRATERPHTYQAKLGETTVTLVLLSTMVTVRAERLTATDQTKVFLSVSFPTVDPLGSVEDALSEFDLLASQIAREITWRLI
jgi:hypothetical protein